MPTFQKTCDVRQGYRYRRDVQTPVGYLTALTIGDVTFAADQLVIDPTDGSERRVVAVLGGAMWELGVTDALYFSGQLSVPNKQQAVQLVYRGLTRVDVGVAFAVHEYDPLAKAYFRCLQPSGGALHGLLEKNGEDLNLSVADDASTDVPSPPNHAFQIGIKPQPLAQALTVATSRATSVVRPWGLAPR